ncbi:MAG: hypothetical protein IPK16_17660 [Anaerolineales bacterium]|nr:hypothetical protein [Anaerolineales bacterium]
MADVLLRQSTHPLELAQRWASHAGVPVIGGDADRMGASCAPCVARRWGVMYADAEQRPHVFHCRPLPKIEALERGDLGGDCSSHAVPLRATSPHHVYYGIWENGKQQRGYMTVFEAWAVNEEEQRLPVLCLETINAPIAVFGAVQQDLLVIFDAIAQSRGFTSPIVLSMGYGTWNYSNAELLRQCRRFRQGEAVGLEPADPVCWRMYSRLSLEAYYYSSFMNYRGSGLLRILAPFDPVLDRVQPENLVEAQRLAALAPVTLQSTMQSEDGSRGFISSWPVPY